MMHAEQIRAELEETRELLRMYAIEAEKADTDSRYKSGRVDACSHAIVLLDNILEESPIWRKWE